MKKNVKLLALAIALSVAMIGAGYAAWGTMISSTTAIQSGEWKIVLEDDSGSSFWAGDEISNFTRSGNNVLKGGTITDTWTGDIDDTLDDYDRDTDLVDRDADGDYVYVMSPEPVIPGTIPGAAGANYTAASFKFYNMHPGTRAYTRFEIRNDGSIPAKIGDVRVKFLDKEGEPLRIGSLPADNPIKQVIKAMQVNPVFNLHLGTGGTESLGLARVSLLGLEAELQSKLIGKKLLPDNTLYSYTANSTGSHELDTGDDYDLLDSFNFELPGAALEGNVGMNAEFQVVIEIDFVQYNQSIVAD